MDIGDHAVELEAADRERALRGAQSHRETAPRIVDGRRVCLDCAEPIPAARLRAEPTADRCVACQEMFERCGGAL